MSNVVKTEVWGSRFGMILAMAGNAVGFGNFLRFPVQAIQNGGGAFIIPYLVSFILLGIPLMLVEWSSGRFGGLLGHHSPPLIMQSMSKRPMWKYIGVVSVFSSVVISCYYCYMESWTLSYVYHSIIGTFNGMSEQQVSGFFDDYLNVKTSSTGIPYESLIGFLLCLALNVWILSKQINKGIERVSKVCMPLLLLFGLFLVIKIVFNRAGENGAINDGWMGLDFLWTPDLTSLSDPKVWLAAAGQIFFTLSLGMGAIQCYSSYLSKRDNIVVESMCSGFLNEFTEIIIGGSVIIPLAVGYLGIDKTIELCQIGAFGLGFRTIPFLFEQWGPLMSMLAGVSFFGLLFGAGITSSLAIGTPMVSFLKDNFNFSRKKSALILGLFTLVYGLPTVAFFSKGVFDEYDYWGGTISLYFFAMAEVILFSWDMGVNKGWKMINQGSPKGMPRFFKFVLRYITPSMLIIVFLSAAIKPKDENWSSLSFKGWEIDNSSIVGVITHKGIGPNHRWFSEEFYAEDAGLVTAVTQQREETNIHLSSPDGRGKVYKIPQQCCNAVQVGDYLQVGDVLYRGRVINDVFYIDVSRIGLVVLMLILLWMIRVSFKRMEEKK